MSPHLIYRDVGPEGIDQIRPLWEKLNAQHVDFSQRFADSLRRRTFETRKQQIIAKAAIGRLHVDLVFEAPGSPPVAYCISTVSTEGVGEMDAIYVQTHLRRQGVGAELTRRALAWLDKMNAASKIVSVMSGNDEALAFYRRFGFHPRSVLLQESH